MTAPQLKSAEPETPLLCGGCGHNLFGASGRCPECGRAFDPNRLIGDLIPWEQRKHAGYVRAYLRTAYLATFRPREIARKVESPVSYYSARLFRRITALVGFVPLLMIGLILMPQVPRGPQASDWEQLFNPWSFAAAMVGLLAGLLAASSITTWFFHRRALPRERRGRAVALSCYACAPLAFVPVLAALWAIALTVSGTMHSAPDFPSFVLWQFQSAPWLLPALAAFVVVPGLHSATVMLRVTARYGIVRVAVSALALPIAWTTAFVAAPLACVLLLAVGYLIVHSFL